MGNPRVWGLYTFLALMCVAAYFFSAALAAAKSAG
jgi:hypothetical protein